MQKGIISRLIIHEILISLKNEFSNFDLLFENQIKQKGINKSDKRMVHSVVFCSMRNYAIINRIVQLYVKKINYRSNNYFLLLSAIAQIIFLSFKEYAVVDSTVELSKRINNTNPKFINGVLRKVIKNKSIIKLDNNFSDLPKWFIKKTKYWDNEQKNYFVKTIKEKPSLHIVFKKEYKINKLKFKGVNTSDHSILLDSYDKIERIEDYKKGMWWIQDFSTMLPLHVLHNIKNKLVIDMCAAPGGKTFQALNKEAMVQSFEINNKKIIIMKKNLKRLGYNIEIINNDICKINLKKKFDVVLLDAPCSSVGTIRRNPEIFYRKQPPNFNNIINIQDQLLNKAKTLVKKNGIILYMVCSFLKEECENQINSFLKNNKNFKLEKFNSDNEFYKKFINKTGNIYILPQKVHEKFFIDGFFAAKITKND